MNLEMQPSKPERKYRLYLIYTLYLLGAFIFWGIRIHYWTLTHEIPFSDMGDYLKTAKTVLCCWDFSHSAFWQSYTKVTLPLFGAGTFAIFGEDNLLAWRYTQTLLNFSGLIWLAWEIRKITSSHILSLSIIWIVALSTSSVFWSYKFATEGLSEALMYVLLAASLNSLNSQTFRRTRFFLTGVIYVLAILNRANMIVVLAAYPVCIWLKHISTGTSGTTRTKFTADLSVFIVGLVLAWSPWLLRGYFLYGNIVPLTTSGVYSFLWELGAVSKVEEGGKITTKTVNELQAEAPARFGSDYEAALHAKQFAWAWLQSNWSDLYPRLIIQRIERSIETKDIALSRVSRRSLFSNQRINALLLDKSMIACVMGALGLGIVGLLRYNSLLILPIAIIGPWLFGSLCIGDPRMLEPSLPLVLAGNVAWIIVILPKTRHQVIPDRS